MKRILNIIIWTALVIGLVILLGFTQRSHSARKVKDIVYNISYSDDAQSDILIAYEDVEAFMNLHFDSLKMRSIGEVDINAIEKKIAEMDYVKNVEAFIHIDGDIHISLSQRRPMVRIMHQNGESFYLDDDGKVMPIRPRYPSKLIICNGFVGHQRYIENHDSVSVPERQEYLLLSEKVQNIYHLAKAIDQNNFLKTQITQIYINDKSEFELIPLLGDQIILFGDISRLDEKLMYLETFYRQETKNLGWTQYKTINLKFKNQVVCTKK